MTTERPQAIDLPIDTTGWIPAKGEVEDLTATRFETAADWSREEPGGEPLYEKVLRESDARKKADLSEDALFERFAAQSGLNDLTGRMPGTREAADLSAPASPGEAVETTATADMSDEQAWRSFVAATGFVDRLPEDGGTADLSEDERRDAEKRAASLREQEEADGLNDALRRQSHEEHFGEQSQMSDEEAWAQYRAALGQGS